jgi:serine/threonine protein kinase
MVSESFGVLPKGYRLLEYEFQGILGQGGFGVTYLAIDLNLNKKVAIKEYFPREFAGRDAGQTIRPAGNKDDRETFEWGLKRFLDEARTLALFEDPNIISVKRFFEANGTAYLVMEYCDGLSLDEVIKKDGPLDEKKLLSLLSPLLASLEKIHSANFLHRDIKPANIYIRIDGSPVLLDFGSARQHLSENSRTVTSLATVGYAPLEQFSSSGMQGPSTDIYGLSATLYKALTGSRPQDALDRVLNDKLIPLSEKLSGNFDIALLEGIDSGLSIRPEDRPQSISQWRTNLFQNILKTGLKPYNIDNRKPPTTSNPQSNNQLLVHKQIYFSLGAFFIASIIIAVVTLQSRALNSVLPTPYPAAEISTNEKISPATKPARKEPPSASNPAPAVKAAKDSPPAQVGIRIGTLSSVSNSVAYIEITTRTGLSVGDVVLINGIPFTVNWLLGDTATIKRIEQAGVNLTNGDAVYLQPGQIRPIAQQTGSYVGNIAFSYPNGSSASFRFPRGVKLQINQNVSVRGISYRIYVVFDESAAITAGSSGIDTSQLSVGDPVYLQN